MFGHNKLTLFAVKAVVSIIGLAVLWPFVAPVYNKLIITVINWLQTANYTFAVNAGGIYLYSPNSEPVIGIHGTALHFGLILLMALIIATPGPNIIHRLKNIGTGIMVMLAIHVATLSLLAKLAQSSTGISGLTMPVVLITTIGLNVLPVLVWVIMSLRRFFVWELRKQNMTLNELDSNSPESVSLDLSGNHP